MVDLYAAAVTSVPFLLLLLANDTKVFGPVPGAGVHRRRHGTVDLFLDLSVIAALAMTFAVSIVELGLVYRCDEVVLPLGMRRIEIDMSMTAPGCGMGDVLRADAERAVRAVPGVDDVEVNLVWDPPWTIHRMTEAARLQLGLL